VAFPLGLIAAITPVTNPTSTAIYKSLLALKTRNGVVVAPHPSAAACTAEAVRVVHDAAVRAGAPPGIISCLAKPSIELTQQLMDSPEINLIWATGGRKMVVAALHTGKPCIVGGEGNCPAIIDEKADIQTAVSSILLSKTFDHGMTCAAEQAVVVVEAVRQQVIDELRRRGAYVLNDTETGAVGAVLLEADLSGVNKQVVGKDAATIAKLAGLEVRFPERTNKCGR
jgi:acetaldehyde dehydrogenase/alcohol dehydrogenase